MKEPWPSNREANRGQPPFDHHEALLRRATKTGSAFVGLASRKLKMRVRNSESDVEDGRGRRSLFWDRCQVGTKSKSGEWR